MSVQILQKPTLAGALPELRTPALSACLGTVSAWIVRSGERRALRELAKHRRLLSDVGLTPEQVIREATKHFWRR